MSGDSPDTASYSDLGAEEVPSTPSASGALPPSDPSQLKAQALELLAILTTWNNEFSGQLIYSHAHLGQYIQVWREFNTLVELEPVLAQDLQLASARASSSLEQLPCWGVTASGNRSKDCKVRATRGFRCGRHLTDGLEDHLQPDEDPYRDCTPLCYTCGVIFAPGYSPLRCSICSRSVHAACLERKLHGTNLSELSSTHLACEACYVFRAPDLAVFQTVRTHEVQSVAGADWWSVDTRDMLFRVAQRSFLSTVYFPLHLSLLSPFMKTGLLSWRSAMGHSHLGQTPQTGLVLLRVPPTLTVTELEAVPEGSESISKDLSTSLAELSISEGHIVADSLLEGTTATVAVPLPPAPVPSTPVLTSTVQDKGKEPVVETVVVPPVAAVVPTVEPDPLVVAESSRVAQLRAQLIAEGAKPRTGEFNRELLKRTAAQKDPVPISLPEPGRVSSLPPPVVKTVKPVVASLTTTTASAPSPEMSALMDMLKGMQSQLTGVQTEMSTLRANSAMPQGERYPQRPFISRYGKKEGLDAFGVHVSNQHHFESAEAECGVDWLGLGDSDAHSTRPDRVRSLIGSASVFYDKSGAKDCYDTFTPKESRFEEWLAVLAKYWLDILRDGQSSVYSETGSFHRVLGRYVLAVLQYLMAIKRAGMTRYSPNWDWPQTWRYLSVVVTELFQGRKMDTTSSHTRWLLTLVTEDMIQSLDGYFVLMPSEDVISAANHSINDRYMRAAGFFESVKTLPAKHTQQDEVPYDRMQRRPWNSCIVCWKPRPQCQGYGNKFGFHCTNPCHPNLKHNACGHRHIWEELGGPRCTPCGKDEPWPLAEKKTAADKPKAGK